MFIVTEYAALKLVNIRNIHNCMSVNCQLMLSKKYVGINPEMGEGEGGGGGGGGPGKIKSGFIGLLILGKVCIPTPLRNKLDPQSPL